MQLAEFSNRMQDWRIPRRMINASVDMRRFLKKTKIDGRVQLGRIQINYLELELGRWLPIIGKIERRNLGRPEFNMCCKAM